MASDFFLILAHPACKMWIIQVPNWGRTAPLTSKLSILYIYSTNIGTEYFKHGIYSPLFYFSNCSLFHNSNVFGSCIIHILCIYSTNIGTEYFKHCIYSPFFPLQNAVCFVILKYLVPVLVTFYIQDVLKFKKIYFRRLKFNLRYILITFSFCISRILYISFCISDVLYIWYFVYLVF